MNLCGPRVYCNPPTAGWVQPFTASPGAMPIAVASLPGQLPWTVFDVRPGIIQTQAPLLPRTLPCNPVASLVTAYGVWGTG